MWFQAQIILILLSAILAVCKWFGYIDSWSWWIVAAPALVALSPYLLVIALFIFGFQIWKKSQGDDAE